MKLTSQQGFTTFQMLIAISLSAIILTSAILLLYHSVRTNIAFRALHKNEKASIKISHLIRESVENLNQFLFHEKYKNHPPDLMIVADDNALQYVIDHKIYERHPIVFVGINSLDRAAISRGLGMTGVIETVNYRETVELILKVHPETTRIVGVTDSSSTGRVTQSNFEREARLVDPSIQVQMVRDWTFDELKQIMHNFKKGTVAVQLSFHKDASGKLAPYIKPYEFFRQFDIPVYTLWKSHGLGQGIMGGYVADGEYHGRLAAEKALHILRGVDPTKIPIDSGAGNFPMFDYRAMTKFGIRIQDLPTGSIVLNNPRNFYDEYYGYIWIGAVSLTIHLVGFLVMLVIYRDRQRLEDYARTREEELMNIKHLNPRIVLPQPAREECPNVDEVFDTLSNVLDRIKT